MPKMLNGIEVPGLCRFVLVRRHFSHLSVERPALVTGENGLHPCLQVYAVRADEPQGSFVAVPHESDADLSDSQLRWRWPPREEQTAARRSCTRCHHEEHREAACAETTDWHEQCACRAGPADFTEQQITALQQVKAPAETPSLEERVRQLEALIDEEPGANDRQKERLQRQLALRNENEKDLRSAHAKLEERLLDARKELDKARLAEAAAMAAGKTACDAMRAERDAVTIDRDAHRDRSAAQEETIRLLRAELTDTRARKAEVEGERDAAEEAREDARCAKRLAGQVTLDTQSAEEAMVAVLKLLEEARRLAFGLATFGSPCCPASSAHDREWIAKEWNERRSAALLFGASVPKAGG